MGADPRLNVFATPVIRPGASEADRALAVLGAQLATQGRMIADLQREIRDLRAAATIQIGASSPAGFPSRDGAPYGRTDKTFWVKYPTGWAGVSMPLT